MIVACCEFNAMSDDPTGRQIWVDANACPSASADVMPAQAGISNSARRATETQGPSVPLNARTRPRAGMTGDDLALCCMGWAIFPARAHDR